MVCIIFLALSSAALLGVGWRGGFSSHKYPDVFSIVGIFPLVGFFLFYKVRRPTPWPFRKILRGTFRSWGFQFEFLGLKFSEEAPKFSSKLMSISARYDGFLLPIFLVFSTHIFRLLIIPPLFSGGGIVIFSSLVYLCDSGSDVIVGTTLQLQAMSQEVFSLSSFFIIMWRRSYQRDLFPYLRQYLLCTLLSS